MESRKTKNRTGYKEKIKLVLVAGIVALAMIPVVTNSTKPSEFSFNPSCTDTASLLLLTSKYNVPQATAVSIVAAVQKATHDDVYPPKSLVYAIMFHESKFNPNASSSGNYGLMQINATANKLKKAELLDIDSNVQHAVAILRYNFARTRSVYGAVVAYNAGLGRYLSSTVRSSQYATRVTATTGTIKAHVQAECA